MLKVAPNYQKESGMASLPITNKFPAKVNTTAGSSRGEPTLAQNEGYLNEKTNSENKQNDAENGEQLRMPEI